jgi:hypothetical protein
MTIRYGKGAWSARLPLGAILVTLVNWPILLRADTGVAQTGDLLESIVVTAKKLTAIVSDEVLKEQVETALHDEFSTTRMKPMLNASSGKKRD